LVSEQFYTWSIEQPEILEISEEKSWFEMIMKTTIPFNVHHYTKLLNEIIEIKVVNVLSNNFVMATFACSIEEDKFKKYAVGLTDYMNNANCWVQDNPKSIGQLVYVYDREILPGCVQHRGQIMDLEIDAENRRYFQVYLIDFGITRRILPSLSLNRIYNLNRFLNYPAQAVPVLIKYENKEKVLELEVDDVIRGKLTSVNQVITLFID